VYVKLIHLDTGPVQYPSAREV